jgi:acyl-coenzyme A thioesterase PaaI-like protein
METYYTTVNLMIDYLYSAPLGSRIKATGKVLRAGKRISNTECYIYSEKGVILVHAKSNLVNTGNPVFELT